MADNNQPKTQLELPPEVREFVRVVRDKLSAKSAEDQDLKMEREISAEIRQIKKSQDKYGRLNVFAARNWKDFGNRVGNNIRLQLTKSYFKKQGRSDEYATKAAFRLIASGSKGVGSILTKFVPIMTGIASTIGLIFTAVEAVLKIVGERGKYLKATSMLSSQGALNNPSNLFRSATLHAGYVNSPYYHKGTFGTFAASQEYKNAYRSMIESGVFAKGNYSTDTAIKQLIESFDDIAAQGLVLGRSFQETSQLISTVGPQYFMGRGASGLNNFGYIHDVIQRGRSAGFNDTNIINMLTNYSKINAYNTNGAFIALNDISKFIRLISNNTNQILDKANPQQIAAQMQSILSANIPFGQFIALSKGMRSFGKSDLPNLAESYRKTGQFEKLANIWETLKNATGMDYKTLMTVAPSYFGGLQGEIGENIIDLITSKKGIFGKEEYKNLSFNDALIKYAAENPNSKDSAQIQYYAQQQMFFEQPLQTIIGLLVSLGQSVIQIASVVALGGKKPSALNVMKESTAQVKNLNKFNEPD